MQNSNNIAPSYNLIDRLQEDADKLGATVVCEQVDETHVRVLAEPKDASFVLCRLLKDPDCGPRAEKYYQDFLGHLAQD